jgi:selenide,water dikinase
MLTSGDKTNREYVGADVEIAPSVDSNLVKLLFDPQTAGGMLIAIAESKAEALLNNLTQNYPHARAIGRVLPESARKIIVSK